jgi:hypothetical protein
MTQRICCAVIGLLPVVLPSVGRAEAPRHLDPIWTLEVQSDKALVTHNDLLTLGLKFPLPTVSLSVTREPQYPREYHIVEAIGPTGVAILPISPRGDVLANLYYVSPRNVCFDEHGSATFVGADIPASLSDYISSFDPKKTTGIGVDGLREWFPALRRDTGVMVTSNRTIVVVDRVVVLELPDPAYEVAFADAAPVVAMCTYVPGTAPETSTSLEVVNFDGGVLSSIRFPPGRSCSKPYLSDDGQWITVTRAGEQKSTIESDEVILVEVESGTLQRMDGLDGGYRHYSDDERYCAEVRAGFGQILLFDIALPHQPKLLTLYREEDGKFFSFAAINADGSLLAALLHTKPKPTDTAMQRSRVIVFNRDLTIVATIDRNPKSNYDISIVGDFLFVGLHGQGGWTPVPSQQIDMYNLRSLR